MIQAKVIDLLFRMLDCQVYVRCSVTTFLRKRKTRVAADVFLNVLLIGMQVLASFRIVDAESLMKL